MEPAFLLGRDISNISTPHLIRLLRRLWERFQAILCNRLIVAALSGFGSKRTQGCCTYRWRRIQKGLLREGIACGSRDSHHAPV